MGTTENRLEFCLEDAYVGTSCTRYTADSARKQQSLEVIIVSKLLWSWAPKFYLGHPELRQACLAMSLLQRGQAFKVPPYITVLHHKMTDASTQTYDVITDVVNVSSMVLEVVYICSLTLYETAIS